MTLVRRSLLCVPVFLALSLAGCEGVGEKIQSIDWQDRGSAGPTAVDGSALSGSVAEALAATPMTMNEQITVGLLRDNRIRLSGSVSSSGAASEAVRVARQVDGVRDVLDTISVQ